MLDNRFLLFLNHLRLLYSNLKSFALLLAFHCFRHTNATLLLNEGVDIYTVSKMLTHRNVSTTQIYTEVIDETKRKAAESIHIRKKTKEE